MLGLCRHCVVCLDYSSIYSYYYCAHWCEIILDDDYYYQLYGPIFCPREFCGWVRIEGSWYVLVNYLSVIMGYVQGLICGLFLEGGIGWRMGCGVRYVLG